MKFKNKPITIEAEQWFPEKEVPGVFLDFHEDSEEICLCGHPHVHTMHKGQICILEAGDWVVQEPDGVHHYPIKPDVFEKRYEPVDEPSTLFNIFGGLGNG